MEAISFQITLAHGYRGWGIGVSGGGDNVRQERPLSAEQALMFAELLGIESVTGKVLDRIEAVAADAAAKLEEARESYPRRVEQARNDVEQALLRSQDADREARRVGIVIDRTADA